MIHFHQNVPYFEFEDVRKLAAELTGRLHPQVRISIIIYMLNHLQSYLKYTDLVISSSLYMVEFVVYFIAITWQKFLKRYV